MKKEGEKKNGRLSSSQICRSQLRLRLPPLCGVFVLALCPSYISENHKVPGPWIAVQGMQPCLQSIPWHERRGARGNLMLATQAL